MALSAPELALQISATEAFVLADAETLSMQAWDKTADKAGGFKLTKDGLPRDITARLIPQSDKVPEIQTSDGKYARIEYVLMATPGTDVRRYDTFLHEGELYRVEQIHRKPEYEIKADCVMHRRQA